MARFQFLIGKIMTGEKESPTADGERFQFLIGKIMTPGRYTHQYSLTQFQFLIGKIMTLFYFILFYLK